MQKTKVGIIGVSGYTGIELLRLLENHAGLNWWKLLPENLQEKPCKRFFLL